MDFLSKIEDIVLFALLIYLFNRYIVKVIIQKMVRFHKKHTDIDRNPAIRFFVNNEQKIISFACNFYWLGGVLIALSILFS